MIYDKASIFFTNNSTTEHTFEVYLILVKVMFEVNTGQIYVLLKINFYQAIASITFYGFIRIPNTISLL